MAVGHSQFVIALLCTLVDVLGSTAGPATRPSYCNVFEGTPMQRHMGLNISRDDDWDEGPRCARCVSRNLSSCSANQRFVDECSIADAIGPDCTGGIDDGGYFCPAGIRSTSNPDMCCFFINQCACPDKETAERYCETGIGWSDWMGVFVDQQHSWTSVWQIELRKVIAKPVVTLFAAQSSLLMLRFLDAHPQLERVLQYADKFVKSLDQLVSAVKTIQAFFRSADGERPLTQLLNTLEDLIDHRWEEYFKQVLGLFDRKARERQALEYFNDTAISSIVNIIPDIYDDIQHCTQTALKLMKAATLLDRVGIMAWTATPESSKLTERFVEGAQLRQERFDKIFRLKEDLAISQTAAARSELLQSTLEELTHMESSSWVEFLFEVEAVASYVKIIDTDPCGCCTLVGSAPIKQLGNYFGIGSYTPTYYGWVEYGKLSQTIVKKVDRIKSSAGCRRPPHPLVLHPGEVVHLIVLSLIGLAVYAWCWWCCSCYCAYAWCWWCWWCCSCYCAYEQAFQEGYHVMDG